MKISKKYLQLFIHSPTGKVITLNNVDSDTFIYDLKSKVELKTGILSEFQDMFINNVRLENRKTLEEMNVKNGSFIRLKMKENSMEKIYVNAINGNTTEVFMLGVQLIENDEINENVDELEQINAWNTFVPLRAFQALFAASFNDQLQLMTQLLNRSAGNIHMVTMNGRSLLHAASSQGHSICVDFLLAQGVDVKLPDKQGMTALMVAAENGHVRVEKRIWLFTWNMDVLSEIKNTTTNDNGEDQQHVTNLETGTQTCNDKYGDNIDSGGCIKLPSIKYKIETYSKNESVQEKATTFPKIGIQSEEHPPKKLQRKTMLNPELRIVAVKADHNSENTVTMEKNFRSKPILQTEEKHVRVSAWVQSTTAKSQIEDSEDRVLQTGIRNSSEIEARLYKKKEIENNNFIAVTNQNDTKYLQNSNQATLCETSCEKVPIPIELGLKSPHCMKREIIKTNPCLINKSNKRDKAKKKLSSKERRQEGDGRFIDTIRQISDETLSFSRRLLMLQPNLFVDAGNGSIVTSNSSCDVNITPDICSISGEDLVNDSYEFPTKAYLCHGDIDREKNISEKYEEVWRPEESLLGSTDFTAFYGKFAKTFEEWLEEKKQLKRGDVKKRTSSSMNNDNVESEKTEKNEEAFEKWLLMKARERIISKTEYVRSESDMKIGEVKSGLTFEEWTKVKRHIQLKQTESSIKKPPRRINRGMTFDQWKTCKFEQQKYSKTKVDETEDDEVVKSGISFEKWLRMKDEQNKLELVLKSTMKAQEEKTKKFLLHFRLNDPHQRTFEEWYLEKKYDFERKKKQSKITSPDKKQTKYPEDSSLIFNMWLLNKYAIDMKNEKGRLKDVVMGRGSEKSSIDHRTLGIIEESEANTLDESSSTNDSD